MKDIMEDLMKVESKMIRRDLEEVLSFTQVIEEVLGW